MKIKISPVMLLRRLLVFCVGSVVVLPSILVLIAFPLVPGIIVNREFRDEVIPTCRNVCPETEIVSGALNTVLGILVILALAAIVFWMFSYAKKMRK